MSCKNSAHVLPPSVTRIQRGLPIGTDIGAEGRTWRRYGPGRRQTADGHRRRIAPEPRSHLSSPGLTINAAINERPNEHGKCTAPGHLSATGSTESAASPSNSTSCELCSRCRAARSCSSHRGEPCHDFLDLSCQHAHRRFRQCLSGTPGCSMRDCILIRDSSTYTLRGNCAVRRNTVAGTYGGTAITSIRVTRKTANTPPIDHACLLKDTWGHEHVAIDAGRTRQVRQRLARTQSCIRADQQRQGRDDAEPVNAAEQELRLR